MPFSGELNVYLLPALVEPERLTDCTVVVIDVLRATTTIVTALASGATEVVPCQEVEDALQLRRQSPGGNILLGGERGGRQIGGFDLGNSPAEYTHQRVAGRTVAFTTTNGTRAMKHAQQARRVLMGAFVNFSAVCRELAGQDRIAILCAGTDGQVTREDALLAGAIVDDLVRVARDSVAGTRHGVAGNGTGYVLNDQAELAADAWRTAVRLMVDRPLGIALRDSLGGRNLMEIGHESDIDLAAQLDRFDVVPELDLAAWRIRVA